MYKYLTLTQGFAKVWALGKLAGCKHQDNFLWWISKKIFVRLWKLSYCISAKKPQWNSCCTLIAITLSITGNQLNFLGKNELQWLKVIINFPSHKVGGRLQDCPMFANWYQPWSSWASIERDKHVCIMSGNCYSSEWWMNVKSKTWNSFWKAGNVHILLIFAVLFPG